MLYLLKRSKEEADEEKERLASPVSPSTMGSLATLALSEDSTIKETNRQTNKPMLWTDTTQFIIFPSRLITRCLWSRPTVSRWGGS